MLNRAAAEKPARDLFQLGQRIGNELPKFFIIKFAEQHFAHSAARIFHNCSILHRDPARVRIESKESNPNHGKKGGTDMNIFYLIGVVAVVLFIAGYFGLR